MDLDPDAELDSQPRLSFDVLRMGSSELELFRFFKEGFKCAFAATTGLKDLSMTLCNGEVEVRWPQSRNNNMIRSLFNEPERTKQALTKMENSFYIKQEQKLLGFVFT